MNIAHVVKMRGNCSRRKVAAVIAKDRRIITTGYNGTPMGVKNCYEGGCARCASDVPPARIDSMTDPYDSGETTIATFA